jgi:predicted dehydrogenase
MTEALRVEAKHFVDCVANGRKPLTDGQAGLRVVQILEAAHFVRCLEEKKQPLTDGEAGLRVVQILEAATESMRHKGRPVELPVAIPQ